MSEIVRLRDFNTKTPVVIHAGKSSFEVSVDDVRRWVAPNAPEPEAMMFLETCRTLGVNPLRREAHLVQKGTNWVVIVDKSAFIRKAEENPNYERFEAGVICQELIRTDPKTTRFGPEERHEGSFVPKTHVATGGWCTVYFKSGKTFKHSVSMDEYSSGQSTWKAMPATMIRKVAIVQALSESGACHRGAAYTPEEIQTVANVVKVSSDQPKEPVSEVVEEVVDVEFVDEAAAHPVAEAVVEVEEVGQPADSDDSAYEPNYVAMDHAKLVADFMDLAKAAQMTDDDIRGALDRRDVSTVDQLDRVQLVSLCRSLREHLDRPFPELIKTHDESVQIAKSLAEQLFRNDEGFDLDGFSNYFLGMFEDDYPQATISGLNPQDLSDLICAFEELVESKKVDPDTLVVPTFRRRTLAAAQ